MTSCIACLLAFDINEKIAVSQCISFSSFHVLVLSLLHCQKLYNLTFLSVYCVSSGQFEMLTLLPVLFAFIRSENLIMQRDDVIN